MIKVSKVICRKYLKKEIEENIKIQPEPQLEALPGCKRWTIETPYLPLLRIFIRIIFIVFWKFLLHQVHTPFFKWPQVPLTPALCSSTPPQLDRPTHIPTHPQSTRKHLLRCPFPGILMQPLCSSSFPDLSGCVNCSFQWWVWGYFTSILIVPVTFLG